jgi:hypothetical protein
VLQHSGAPSRSCAMGLFRSGDRAGSGAAGAPLPADAVPGAGHAPLVEQPARLRAEREVGDLGPAALQLLPTASWEELAEGDGEGTMPPPAVPAGVARTAGRDGSSRAEAGELAGELEPRHWTPAAFAVAGPQLGWRAMLRGSAAAGWRDAVS